MNTFLVILLSFLMTTTFTLHTKYHQSPTTYLNTLKSQQNSISTTIQTIKSSISQSQQNIQSTPDLQQKITILQNTILQQKTTLTSLTNSLTIPLNDSSWVCQNLVGTSLPQLQTLANSILNSTKYLSNTINGLSNSTSIPYYSPDANGANSMAQTIQQSLYSTGSQINTVQTTNQTNWFAPNWITGNQTLQQIDQQVQQARQNNNTQFCPIDIPYFDGTQCITCPSLAPYFNLQVKTCTTCLNYDPNTHTCTPSPINNYNQSNYATGLNRTILPPDVTQSSLTNQTGNACPSNLPFFAGGTCIDCAPPNSLFNYSTSLCTTCPSPLTFVAERHQCIDSRAVYVTNLPAASNRLILPAGTKISDLQNAQNNLSTTYTVIPCPTLTPFYNNVTCINCPDNNYFNVQILICQACPGQSAYNQSTYSCMATAYYSNLNNRNWTSTNPESVRQSVATASNSYGATVCPDATPFFDGIRCVGCPDGLQFSFDGLKCQACTVNTVFSVNQHSCVIPQLGMYQTNVTTAPNLIYGGTSRGQWITIYKQNQQQNPQILDCPAAHPYYDNIRCITCPASYPYFNLRYLVCQVCDINSSYDSTVHECLTQSGAIVSQQPNIEKMVASIFS